jgi:hypothetical protein
VSKAFLKGRVEGGRSWEVEGRGQVIGGRIFVKERA